jgi:hypothetical protein
VRHTGWDDDHLTGFRRDALALDPEPHPALDHLEALLLQRVEVEPTRDTAARGKRELDRDELPVRLSAVVRNVMRCRLPG